jgi:hypothetical protein
LVVVFGFTNAENLDAISVAIGEKFCDTIFLGVFSFEENLDVEIPAAIVFPVLSKIE